MGQIVLVHRLAHRDVRRIAGNELTQARRSPLLWVGLSVVWLSVLFAVWSDCWTAASLSESRDAANQAERVNWMAQGQVAIHKAAHIGVYVFKEPSPTMALDRGIDEYTGSAVWLESHKQNDPILRAADRVPGFERLGSLSAAFTLQLLVPLFIVLLGHDSFSREREHGMLQYLMSLGVRPTDFVAGKMLALGGLTATLILPPVSIAVLSVGFFGDVPLEALFGRVILLLLLYSVYYAIFVLVTVTVSVFARSTMAALLFLLTFWLVNGFFAPRLLADATAAARPLPSAAAVRGAIDREVEYLDIQPVMDQRIKDLLLEHDVDRPEELPFNLAGLEYLVSEEMSNRVHDKHLGPVRERLRLQTRLYQLGSVVSPQVGISLLSQGLAGTDLLAHLAFVEGAERHRRNMQRILHEGMLYEDTRGDVVTHARSDARLWERVPTFDTPLPRVAEVAGFYLPAVGILLGWLALAAVVALWSLSRIRYAVT